MTRSPIPPYLTIGGLAPLPLRQQNLTAMATSYYMSRLRIDGKDHYMIWYSKDIDGVLLGEDCRILLFRSIAALRHYASVNGLEIDLEEVHSYDFDRLARWLSRPNANGVDCDSFNSLWNLFTDVSHSLGEEFEIGHHLTGRIYDKLLRGCNLPSMAMAPEEEWYQPIWNEEELALMARVLGQGMEMVKNSMRLV